MVVPEEIATALENDDVAAVRLWLTSGVRDANDVDSNGWTPLQRTLRRQETSATVGPSRVEMLRLLIEHGADANASNRQDGGLEPIFLCDYPEEVRVLLDAGVDVNVFSRGGNTPLMHCGRLASCFPFIVDVAKFLVKHGADVSLTNRLGQDAETITRVASNMMQSLAEEQQLDSRFALADWVPARHLADWLADVRRAGGYAKFVKEPRVALARLRLLCERGRASPPDGGATKEARALERLFGPRTPLPRGVFWLVAQYWRSDRDA